LLFIKPFCFECSDIANSEGKNKQKIQYRQGNKEKVVEPSETNFREIIWMIENLFVILQHILQNTVFL